MPPACFPTLTDPWSDSVSRFITSTFPGSPPTPSSEINAYLLSGETTTPCETLVVFLIFFKNLLFFKDQIETAPSDLSVANKNFPFGEIARLYGPSPVLNVSVTEKDCRSTTKIWFKKQNISSGYW